MKEQNGKAPLADSVVFFILFVPVVRGTATVFFM